MDDNREMRVVYVEALGGLMAENKDIVALGADLMSSSGTKNLAAQFPQRVINCGVAEANMVATAAGLSTCGKVVFCDTFAAFMSRRDTDQVTVSVCYAGQNVKLVGTDPGLAATRNGGTHMAIEDVGIMRTIPTMTIFEPCDNRQLVKALPVLAAMYGPLYMRLYKPVPVPVYGEDYEFVFGKADLLLDGADATVIASGITVKNALKAAEQLKIEGVGIRVLNMHTIKPLDEAAVLKAAAQTGAIVSVENSNTINGLGSAIAETLCDNDAHVPFTRLGIRDRFGEVGTEEYLMRQFGMAAEDIVEAVHKVLARKK